VSSLVLSGRTSRHHVPRDTPIGTVTEIALRTPAIDAAYCTPAPPRVAA